MSKPREVPGASTAQRCLRLLKLLGAHHARGLSAAEIVSATGDERSAVQRALSSLLAEGLVQRSTRRYHLGVESLHLGLATLVQSPLVDACRPVLQQMARVTGDTVFMSVRFGDHILCVYRGEGSSPVRAFRTREGDVRVLGTTAGGLALLARLDDQRIRAIYDHHTPVFDQARLDYATLRRHVARTRRDGYAVLSDNVSVGVTAIGISLLRNGEPFATAAIAAAKPRMAQNRLEALFEMLKTLKTVSWPFDA